MSTTLKKLQEINLNEISLIKEKLGISFDANADAFKLHKPVSTQDLVDLYYGLRKDIWPVKNVQAIVSELEQPPDRTRLHYFGPGYPSEITGFISKMGLLNHVILIEDPLCFPLSVKPTFPDHILRSPHLYLKHIFENGLMMVYLEDWVKSGYLFFIPSLPLIDTTAFWEIAKINESLASSTNFEQTKGTQKSINYGMAEGSIRINLDFIRLAQQNYKTEHVKRIFPTATQEELEEYLELIKSQSLEEREATALDFALNKFDLTEKEKLSLQNQFSKSRLFNIERYLDISQLNDNLMGTSGMPLLQATYLGERLNCIPATDHLGLMYGYEGWCEALGQDFDADFENARVKVELPFSFLNDLPLEFVQEVRSENKVVKTTQYLDEVWAKIRTAHDLNSYKKASMDFFQRVSADYLELQQEQELVFDELHAGIRKTGFAGLGTFVAGNIVTEMPLTIIGTLATILYSAIDTQLAYKKGKQELKINPLAVFLEAENKVSL